MPGFYEFLIEFVKRKNGSIGLANQRRVEVARLFDAARQSGCATNELQELVRQISGVDVGKNILLEVARHNNHISMLKLVTTYPRLVTVVDGKLCIRGGKFTQFVIWGLPILQIIGALMCLLGIAWVLIKLVGVLHVLTPAEWQLLATHRWGFVDIPVFAPDGFLLGVVAFEVAMMFYCMRNMCLGLKKHLDWSQARAEIEPRLK